MQYFDSPTDFISYALAATAILCAAIASYIYISNTRKVTSLAKRQNEEEIEPDTTAWPDVSIVVYSYNDVDGLSELLPTLINQDYPGVYEIIVVNDGADKATDNLLTTLEKEHSGLYHTFTPRDTSNLSRKKLALMLGIKAAHHDILHLVTSESRIPSDNWLKRMTRHFLNPDTQVVIGYAYPDPECDTERGRNRRLHDHLIDGVCYLGAPCAGAIPEPPSTATHTAATATTSPTGGRCFSPTKASAVHSSWHTATTTCSSPK